MTKKIPFALLTLFFAFSAFGQTIVSTDVEERKVILEEFTGINCVFCPDGHARAKALQDDNPGNVFLVNIHTGGFANPTGNQPDFRTPFGGAIAAQTGLTGYPSGTINRQNFPGLEQGAAGTTAMNRGNWVTAANLVLPTESYLNMAVEANIDVQTRELTVHVESYYTGDSPEDSNFLNVALLQNRTLGPQTGGGMGNNYSHEHRLVHMVTGQWGEEITTTTTGTFVDRNYTYTIPADYNDIEAVVDDMEIVVFMTESTQYIISGNGTFPTYSGITIANDTGLTDVADIPLNCPGVISPEITIKNFGANPLTSLDIEYSVNGGTAETYTWTGNLTSLQRETVTLPEVSFDLQASNTLEVLIPDDDENSNNSGSVTFEEALTGSANVTLTIETDQYANEIRWDIKDGEGNIIEMDVLNGGDNNSTLTYDFEFDADCYTLTVIDSFGDGILGGGGVSLIDATGIELYPFNGNYGSGFSREFGSNGILGVEENNIQNVVLYPNPASTILHIRNAENASIEVYDILGKLVMTSSDIAVDTQLEVSKLQTGTYFVKIYGDDGGISTKKFLIAR